jgi:hypothetical protein
MNSLADAGTLESLLTRLGKLTTRRPRAWGRMTAHEMMCHLADAFEVALGERPFVPADTWTQRTILKYVALRTTYKWPKGIKTLPEVDQGGGGTRPGDFERDRARLVALIHRFAAADAKYAARHPALGPMTREEWLIWGYRHTDHHLRQFAL